MIIKKPFHFRLTNILHILFYLQVISLHHRIVQFSDNFYILVTVKFQLFGVTDGGICTVNGKTFPVLHNFAESFR